MTVKTRKSEASQACFYNDGETLYRILYTSEDSEKESITVLDEATGEEYVIPYSEVPAEAKFYKLVEVE